MRKWFKKITAVALAATFVVTLPMAGITAKADAVTDAKPSDVYVSFGADLKDDEKATVLGLMGITEADLENYTVGQITNEEEHKYLGSYLDVSVLGTRALSSVIVVIGEDGDGINVKSNNISYCTPGMYTNALITAGIEDADVIVAGPFEITGTAALVGAMKAYAEEHGYPYFDMFELAEEVGLNGETDFSDAGHLNDSGAIKVADYLGKYIVEHYDVTDMRTVQNNLWEK